MSKLDSSFLGHLTNGMRQRPTFAAMIVLLWVLPMIPTGAATVVLDDSFENSFKPMWTRSGGTTTTSDVAHGFYHSYLSNPPQVPGADIGFIHAAIAPQVPGFASIWFYEDGGASKTQMFLLRGPNGPPESFGVGVFTPISSSNYVCERGSQVVSTSIPRSFGWHEFRVEWDYFIGGDIVYFLMIDGQYTGCAFARSFLPARVVVGDAWIFAYTPDRGYWDDFYLGNDL